MPRVISAERWNAYVDARIAGEPRTTSCRRLGIAYKAAISFDSGDPRSSGIDIWAKRCKGKYPWNGAQFAVPKYGTAGRPRHRREGSDVFPTAVEGALLLKPRNDEAKRALIDFEFFRSRYFGHVSLPWHIEAGERLVGELEDAIERGERRFILMNTPPGAGKTTLMHDFGLWVTARNRAIRGGNVSRAEPLAIRNTARMKRSLERVSPVRAKPGDLQKGLACNGSGTLGGDFGPFRPESRQDVWTRESFIVVQADGQAIMEKEPTWSSYGLESAILGNRLDLIICDDLVDKANIRTVEGRQTARDSFGDEVEKRLDDGGLLLVVGQRMHIDDLYSWVRDMPADVDEFEPSGTSGRKYTHILYPAHFPAKCDQNHGRNAEAWPQGCLLDPLRLSWRTLQAERARDIPKFELIYNQDDSASGEDILAKREWVDECWDVDRRVWQRPSVSGEALRVVTVDPSGTRWWAVQAWCYDPAGDDGLGGRRYLLDVENAKMDAPDLLDRNYDSGVYYGLLEEWRKMFAAIGMPLEYVVVEVNAAQRYLLQYPHIQRWGEMHGVHFMSHSTSVRKLDAELGVVGSCRPQWEFHRVRLPGGDSESRHRVKPFVDQVLRWPVEPNDQPMSHYFLEANLPSMYTPPMVGDQFEHRPSWLRGAA